MELQPFLLSYISLIIYHVINWDFCTYLDNFVAWCHIENQSCINKLQLKHCGETLSTKCYVPVCFLMCSLWTSKYCVFGGGKGGEIMCLCELLEIFSCIAHAQCVLCYSEIIIKKCLLTMDCLFLLGKSLGKKLIKPQQINNSSHQWMKITQH